MSSILTDESTIHNQTILLIYVRFIHVDDVGEEILFNSLPKTTNGEDVFNEVMQYFHDIKNTPFTNWTYIASDGAAEMTERVKGFVPGMKSVSPHIFHINCIIHRQHLVTKNIGGDME